MNSYIIEFIGTFFLVLVIALTGNPIAIGMVLVALVYMGGYISGAHYNPAVTLAVFLRGKIDATKAGMYVLYQILGAVSAAVIFYAIKGTTFVPTPGVEGFAIPMLVEIILTFLLVSVILHVATSEETEGNHYYGIAIGATLMAIAFAGGSISGGVYNPAVAIGTVLVDVKNITVHMIPLLVYILGPIVGGAFAATVYRFTRLQTVRTSSEDAMEEVVD